jgi:hypothetical protein
MRVEWFIGGEKRGGLAPTSTTSVDVSIWPEV